MWVSCVLRMSSSLNFIRYYSAYGYYYDFRDWGLLLRRKSLNQEFLLAKLTSALRTFYVVTMTWLTVTVYLYHIWLGISFICRNHNHGLSLFTTYHRVCNKITTTGATCEEGTTFSSGSPRCLVLLLDILFCAWCVLDHCLSFSQPYQLHPLYFYQLNRPITMPSVCFSYCL